MRPTFHPSLVNDPFHDPCLYINFIFDNRAITFDLGDIPGLSPKDLLKITHGFITHTHIDHFAGFDRLLRIILGRDKRLHLFGPENFLDNIEGKLSGYNWNLAANYADSLTIHATEVNPDGLRTRTYQCRERFCSANPVIDQPYTGLLLSEPGLSVSSVILDHDIPCLGFRLNERFHININKAALNALGLEPGPWLNSFKQALFSGCSENAEVAVPVTDGLRSFKIGKLAEKIAIISPGQTITYITDAALSESNTQKIIEFAHDSDHLFIETHFLDQDREAALAKYHLTARQAGKIAGLAHARRLTTFHYSPRYTDQSGLLEQEARQAHQEYRHDH